MGRGGTPASLPPECPQKGNPCRGNGTNQKRFPRAIVQVYGNVPVRPDPAHPRRDGTATGAVRGPEATVKARAISSARLWRRRLYTCALSTSSSVTALKGSLILRGASRLDAFSAYPLPAWVPCDAPGGTTGSPEASPARSSRTSARSAQKPCAHDR